MESRKSSLMRAMASAVPLCARRCEVRDHQIFAHREIAEHARHLERAYEAARSDAMRPKAGDRGAVQQDLPLVGPLDASDEIDERRLARAVRSDKAADLACRERNRDAVIGH